MAAQYVRFMRGNTQAFNQLVHKDNDTLYFIYDNDDDGKLYLGDRLIAGSDIRKLSIDELRDVVISEGVSENSLLIYENNEWVNKPLEEAISVFVGSTAASDGVAGFVPAPPRSEELQFLSSDGTWRVIEVGDQLQFNPNIFVQHVDGTLDLVGFESAAAGAQPQKGADGTLQWVTPDATTVEGLSSAVAGLRQDVTNIVTNTYTKNETQSVIKEAIANAPHLKRKIVSSIEEAEDYVNNNADSIDYIFMIPSGESYDQYIAIAEEDGTRSLQKVGSLGIDLDKYVTDEDFFYYLKDKVDKEEGSRLITEPEINKLNDLLPIQSIDGTLDFNIETKTLGVKSIAISQVVDLSKELRRKAEADKVAALEIDVNDLKERLIWDEFI